MTFGKVAHIEWIRCTQWDVHETYQATHHKQSNSHESFNSGIFHFIDLDCDLQMVSGNEESETM